MADVHTRHCCVLHGCKYGDNDCHVANGKVPQDCACESCGDEGINTLEELKFEQLSSVIRIKSTDKKFMSDLIDFLDSYKEIPDSTIVTIGGD